MFKKIYKTKYGETFFREGSCKPVIYSIIGNPFCKHEYETIRCTTGGGWMASNDIVSICKKCGKKI